MSKFRYINAISDPAKIRVGIRNEDGSWTYLTLSEDDARNVRNELARELRYARILNRARTKAYDEIGRLARSGK